MSKSHSAHGDVQSAGPVVSVLHNWATEQIFHDFEPGYDIGLVAADDAAGRARLRDTEVLVVALAPIDARLLDLAPRLRLVLNFGVGLDLLDMAALRARGVRVANTPGYNADVVAEHALMLLLVLSRGFVRSYLDLKMRGKWRGSGPWSWELKGKRLGIIGFGEVGKALARKARGLEMTVSAWNRRGDPRPPRDGVDFLNFTALLAASDALCVCAPLTAQTRGLVGRQALQAMKPGAVLLNVGRGAIVDQTALLEAVTSGHLRGAGLDVTDPEPLAPDDPLLGVDNIVITPHCAGTSTDTRARGRRRIYANIDRYARGDTLRGEVAP